MVEPNTRSCVFCIFVFVFVAQLAGPSFGHLGRQRYSNSASAGGQGAAGNGDLAEVANFSLLIPVECGYGFRDGKLCPGYPQFVSRPAHICARRGQPEFLLARRLAPIPATTERLMGE